MLYQKGDGGKGGEAVAANITGDHFFISSKAAKKDQNYL